MKVSFSNNTSILLLLIFLFFFSCVHSQILDSCNSPLNLPNPLPFDTNSLQCVMVWGSQNFILRYVQTSPKIWSFVLSAPNTNAYIGIGFSPNYGNMVGSTAIVGWIGNNVANSGIKKYYLGGKTPNLVRLEASDEGLQVDNLYLISMQNQIYMSFQLTTDNPTTSLIYAIGPTGQLPSSPNFLLTKHQDMLSTILNYAKGGRYETQSSPEASLKRIHGILNMVGWGILLPIGAMVARYMRHLDPIWYYSHAIIQSSGFMIGVVGLFCGLVLENRLDISVDKHKTIGIFILILGCLQVIAIFARPRKTSKIRRYWNWYHSNVGRVLIVLAIINIFYGISLGKAGSDWNKGYGIVVVILFIISVILELRKWMREIE